MRFAVFISVLLMIKVIRDVMLCHCVSGLQHHEGT